MGSGTLTDTLRETLALFEAPGEPRTTTEVAERLDLGRRSTYDRLERLAEQGRLDTKKVGANARVWWRPTTGTDGATSDRTLGDREQFESLVAAVEEYAIFMLDTEGYVQTWNPGAEQIKGYAAEEIVGTHFSQFYTEDDRAAHVPERNLAVAARQGSVEDEGWRRRQDGSRFWANVTITAVTDEDGTLEGYAKVTRDMTERREYERQLREERALIESLLDNQQDLFYAYDVEDGLFRWNERVSEVTGYTDAEISEMHPVEFLADEAVEEAVETIERVIEHGESQTVEFPLVTADGEKIPYEFAGGPITDEDGTITGFTGAARDISERKARERQLERQRDELRAELDEVFRRIDEAFFAFDDDWRCTYVNDQAAALVGDSAGELLGALVSDVLPGIASDTPGESIERAMETQKPVEFTVHSGELDRWIEVRGYPSETGISVYARDVTEREERERALEESRHRYRALVENFPNGAVALVDEHLDYVAFGGTPLDPIGATADELRGRPLEEVLPREVADKLCPCYERALGGDPSTFRGQFGESIYRFYFIPVRDDDGEVFAAMGMSQDVTESIEREQELEKRLRQQEVIADFGQRALAAQDVDALMAEATGIVAETLDTNYCKVLDLDREAEELLLREGVGWGEGIVGSATVSAVENDSQAAFTLATEQPVVVTDLDNDPRFGGPDLLRDHDVKSGISTIIGSPDDPWGVLGTHDTTDREFSEHDAKFVQSVANVLITAINRHERERELVYQREQLAALNNLNEVVRDITDVVIEQSTREEIEETVCDRLAASDSYLFAWIGDVDSATQTVNLRTEAGVEGCLDDVSISVDPDDEQSRGPIGQTLRTGELQVVRGTGHESGTEVWDHVAGESGFHSAAAIPITHENTVYGVLSIYSDRADAFEGEERAVVEQLGEVVGHAIAATDRKRALLSDELVELEFQVQDAFSMADAPIEIHGRITFDHTVPVTDGEFLVYGTATPDAVDALSRLVEVIPAWESVTVRSEGEPARFELRLTEPPVLSVIASHGGSIDQAVIEDGDYRMTVHLPPTVDVRQVIDSIEATYPGAEMLRRRQVSQPQDGPQRAQHHLTADLTDRQRAALEAAYHSGFFEWPRASDGESIAASLGVASPTFHQHLRKAEKKVFDSLFVSSRDAISGDA